MNQLRFSSGLELAPFVTSSGLLPRSCKVTSSLCAEVNSNVGLSYRKVHDEESGVTFIAFVTTPVCTQDQIQPDLVSSSALKEKNFRHFDFLCTNSNPVFSVNNTAVSLFHENYQKLDQLKSEINSSTRLIVTGHALGGSVASLFTLSLLDSIGSGKNRPLCITFGSPLIGDKTLQQAISRSSAWNSCFLHVVSLKDPLPRLFITNHSSPAHISTYVPFGTFLLCSDVNSTCSENPDSILELLGAMGSNHVQNQGFQSADYGNLVENLYHKAICRDFTTQAENRSDSDSLLASISLQLCALELTPRMQQQQQLNIDINTLQTKMKILEERFIWQKRTIFDPSRKLNVVKKDMAQLEWYKKKTKNEGIGYYDSFKNMYTRADHDVVGFQKNLTLYWEKMVEEAEMKPQKEGASFRTRWLFAGTNYRRMVEPLVIAQYYREGGKDYVNRKRSKHYKQLEEWLKEGTTAATSGLNSTSKLNVESILTLDSCFWAHVEEALLLCQEFKVVTQKEEARKKLLEFEDYVYGLLKSYAVSPEIFLERSSYMLWWSEYKALKETTYNSALASFMSNRRNYEQYAVGAFDFL